MISSPVETDDDFVVSDNDNLIEVAIASVDILERYRLGDTSYSPMEIETARRFVIHACRQSFWFFTKHIMGFDLVQEDVHGKWCSDIQEAFWKFKRIMRLFPRKTYKCLEYGTPIFPIGINSKLKTVPVDLKYGDKFEEDGIEVITRSGRKVVCTKDHPFKIIDGWETAKKGLRIGVVRNDKDKFHDLSGTDVFWDEVVEVRDVGIITFQRVGSSQKNYISENGIIHHNTTVFGEAFPLWVWAAISPEIRIYYTSASSALLNEVSAHLDTYLGSKHCSLYSFVFDLWRLEKKKDNRTTNTKSAFNLNKVGKSKRGHSLTLSTANSNVTGTHPHLIIVDDPVDKNDRESTAIREKRKLWFDINSPLLVPFNLGRHIIQHIIYIGTRWHFDDLPGYIIDSNKDKSEGNKWDIQVKGAYDEDGNLEFPTILSEEVLRNEKENIKDEDFYNCNYLNSPLPASQRIFNSDLFTYFDPVEDHDGVLYCYLDPAKGLTKGDFPAVIWLLWNGQTALLVDAITEKIPLELIVEGMAKINQKTGCYFVTYEEVGAGLVGKALKDEHKKIEHKVKIRGVTHVRPKDTRIRTLPYFLNNGILQLRKDWEIKYPEIMTQLRLYPVWRHDDFPDVMELGMSDLKKRGNPTGFFKAKREKIRMFRNNREPVLEGNRGYSQLLKATRMKVKPKGMSQYEHTLMFEMRSARGIEELTELRKKFQSEEGIQTAEKLAEQLKIQMGWT